MRLWWLWVSIRGTSVLYQLFEEIKKEMKGWNDQYNDRNKLTKRGFIDEKEKWECLILREVPGVSGLGR